MAKLVKPFHEDWPLLETNLFGANPPFYSKFGLAGHDGVDWMCPTGTDIIAPIAGKVYVGWDPMGWGLYISIDNNWGWCVVCHLKDNLVSTGSIMSQGQLVAHSDNTGNSSGPHVHLGLKVKGISNPSMKNFVDPLPYLQETIETVAVPKEKFEELVTKSTKYDGQNPPYDQIKQKLSEVLPQLEGANVTIKSEQEFDTKLARLLDVAILPSAIEGAITELIGKEDDLRIMTRNFQESQRAVETRDIDIGKLDKKVKELEDKIASAVDMHDYYAQLEINLQNLEAKLDICKTERKELNKYESMELIKELINRLFGKRGEKNG